MISVAHQQVVEVRAETGQRRAVIDAEKLAQVAKIQYEPKILAKESEKGSSRSIPKLIWSKDVHWLK